MRSFIVSLSALAVANAWSYPYCDTTNCYNNMVNPDGAAAASSWCPQFLAGTTTATSAIPTALFNCHGIQEASSACSCITYAMTSGMTKTTSAPVKTTSTTMSTSTTSCSTSVSASAPMSTSTSSYTTSTVYTTKVYTVTSCAPTVTNCPAKPHVTTEVSILYTTVCPVTESAPVSVPATTPTPVTSVGTVTKATPTSSSATLVVTAAADRVYAGFGVAAAGLVAALL